MKTDNAALVGVHCFEKAGLGKAPFRFVAMQINVYVTAGGAHTQAGGTCDYCGTGIMHECVIKSADGKQFVVGTNCVEKTGDAGIIKGYKNSPEWRKHQRDLREAKSAKAYKELAELILNPPPGLKAKMHTKYDGTQQPYTEYLDWIVPRCGTAGRLRYLRFAKSLG